MSETTYTVYRSRTTHGSGYAANWSGELAGGGHIGHTADEAAQRMTKNTGVLNVSLDFQEERTGTRKLGLLEYLKLVSALKARTQEAGTPELRLPSFGEVVKKTLTSFLER
jgi:hypothetical protein